MKSCATPGCLFCILLVFVRKDENQTRNLIRKKKKKKNCGMLQESQKKERDWFKLIWRNDDDMLRNEGLKMNDVVVFFANSITVVCVGSQFQERGTHPRNKFHRGWKLSCGDSKTMQLSSISTELYTYYTWNQCHHLFWTINSSSKWSASHSTMAARNWSRWSATRLTLFLQGLAGRGIEESDGEWWLHMQHLACILQMLFLTTGYNELKFRSYNYNYFLFVCNMPENAWSIF